jgi:hypothetical protein
MAAMLLDHYHVVVVPVTPTAIMVAVMVAVANTNGNALFGACRCHGNRKGENADGSE